MRRLSLLATSILILSSAGIAQGHQWSQRSRPPRAMFSYQGHPAPTTKPAPIANWPLINAQAAAVDQWGQPCDGEVTIDYSATVPAGLPPSVAWTWFVTPNGAMDYSEPPSTYTDCTITLNSNYFSPNQQTAAFPLFCAVMVREYAHLWGYGDDYSEPHTSILYPIITAENIHVQTCVALYSNVG